MVVKWKTVISNLLSQLSLPWAANDSPGHRHHDLPAGVQLWKWSDGELGQDRFWSTVTKLRAAECLARPWAGWAPKGAFGPKVQSARPAPVYLKFFGAFWAGFLQFLARLFASFVLVFIDFSSLSACCWFHFALFSSNCFSFPCMCSSRFLSLPLLNSVQGFSVMFWSHCKMTVDLLGFVFSRF